MNSREFVGTVPFFAEVLDDAQLDALAASARRTDFDHQAVIMQEHQAGSSMFAIVRGTAEVSTRHARRESHIATLHSRDIVGEMSLFTGKPRSATVVAIGPVVALEIIKSDLQPILDASPSLCERFATVLGNRRAEIDKIHGDGFWNLYGIPRDRIAPAIRGFFGQLRGA